MLAKDPQVRFIGYGLFHGRAMGTLKDVPEKQIVEMPTAENLMTGVAIGYSLAGLKPVLYFERADFLLNAADAIVNHLAAMKKLSRGEFSPAAIIRVTIGNRCKPLFTGPVHTQDFAAQFRDMTKFHTRYVEPDPPDFTDELVHSVERCSASFVDKLYRGALEAIGRGESTMIFELKDKM